MCTFAIGFKWRERSALNKTASDVSVHNAVTDEVAIA